MEIQQPRFQIKLSRRTTPSEDTQTFADKWATVSAFVQKLICSTGSVPDLRGITHAQNIIKQLCIRGLQFRVQNELNLLFYRLFNTLVRNLMPQGGIADHSAAWKLAQYYETLTRHLVTLGELMQPLESTFLRDKEDRTIRRIVLRVLHHEICNQTAVEEDLAQAFLQVVEDYREDKIQLDARCRLLLQLCLDIGLFCKSIQTEFFERSKTYYIHKRARLPGNVSFLNAIDREIQKEQVLTQLLTPSEDIIAVIDKELITENLETMLNFVEYLINCQCYSELSLIWRFLGRVSSRFLLQKRIQDLILSYDTRVAEGQVAAAISYKLLIEKAIASSFESDKAIGRLVDNTFQTLFSSNFQASSKAIIKHVLANGHNETEPYSFEMFKCSPSADLLVRFYSFQMAKQILTHNPRLPTNLYAHTLLADKLTDFFGMGLISKLSGMLSDVFRDGRQRVEQTYGDGVFRVRMLHDAHWPKYKTNTISNLPDELRKYRDGFQDHFGQTHPTHQLSWVCGLGRVQLNIAGVEVEVGEVQAAAIFIISKAIRPLMTSQLSDALGFQESALEPLLQQLTTGGILTSVARSRYELNWDILQSFTSKKTYEQPTDAVDSTAIARDKDLVVDAAIVKLTKRRKALLRTELVKIVSETLRQFRPTLQQIKRSLKNLSDREFIELQGSEVRYRA